MRIICAPDSFKESMTAHEAAEAMARGIHRTSPQAQVDLCPIADGGEGTVAAMLAATGGESRSSRLRGPLGEEVSAVWGLLGRQSGEPITAVIEMAAASGLVLSPPGHRYPMRASTFGTGQMILAALDAGAQRILLGIGGSATNDGGTGMAQAMGVHFIDINGQIITETMCGGLIPRIHRIDISRLDPRIAHARIIVACDVTNPMTGLNGASHIYGPQKGATPSQVAQLDAALEHLASLFERQLGKQVRDVPGAGAAGGLGGGLLAFLHAELQRGIDVVLAATDFHRRVRGCDLCLTGEGKLDGQSLSGKACLGVAAAARGHGVPTVALVGCIGSEVEKTLQAGLSAYHVIGENIPAEESIRRGQELLETATEKVLRQWMKP